MRSLLLLLTVLVTLASVSSATFALTIQTAKGGQVELDEFNYLIKDGTLFVPIQRLIDLLPYEALPGKGISWNQVEKKISLQGSDIEKEWQYRFSYSYLTPTSFYKGSQSYKLAMKPFSMYKNGPLFFPVRDILAAYGYSTIWQKDRLQITADSPLKIYWNNKNIANSLAPAMSAGQVYVVDSNFMRVVRGYESVQPLFKKNDEGKWQQYALSYSSGNKQASKLELIQNVRIYTDAKKIGVNDSTGFNHLPLKFATRKAKAKTGSVDFMLEEQKWVDDSAGKRFVGDRNAKSEQSEFHLHYVSLTDLCSVFDLKLTFDAKQNTYFLK